EIKSEFDGVQNTYVTANPLMGLYRATTSIGKHRHELTIRLLDTWLLVPEGSKGLGTLGDMYNYLKLKVGKGPGRAEFHRVHGSPPARRPGLVQAICDPGCGNHCPTCCRAFALCQGGIRSWARRAPLHAEWTLGR